MSDQAKQEITVLLKNLKSDDSKSTQDEIIKILYRELRSFAGNIIKKENQTLTIQATELVNEAYLRMFDSENMDWNDRSHFLSSAIVVMRRYLVDHARKKNTAKRISKNALTSLDENLSTLDSFEVDVVGLDDALTDLEQMDPRQARIVEMRFFGGLSETEVAKLLDISRSTVKREWKAAKMWLLHQLTE